MPRKTVIDAEDSERIETLEAEVGQLRLQLKERTEQAAQLADAVFAEEDQQGNLDTHIIAIPERLRRAWRNSWQFRLFITTLSLAIVAAFGKQSDAVGIGFAALGVFLFGCWSVCLFRRMGLGQMLLKWVLYSGGIMACGAVGEHVDIESRAQVMIAVLSAGTLLTFSHISIWVGDWIYEHIWESGVVQKIRSWFV